MKDCTNCINAEWQKREDGKLHPGGDGNCTWKLKVPVLPSSMHWWIGKEPVAHGGHINRRELLKEHCPHWTRKS